MSKFEHVVVTGAGGFIGRALVKMLVSEGVEVVALSRKLIPDLGCKNFEIEIETPGCLDDFLTPYTTLFHLAAHADVAGSVRQPMNDFNVNVRGLMNVLESLRAKGGSLIYPSTSAVYEPSQPLPHKENALRRPSSPYAAAKIAGEAYCDAFQRCYGLDIKIARLFNVYGPGMNRFAIRDFYKKIKTNPEQLQILGNGSQVRDYMHIEDCVRGLMLVATNGMSGEDYNLGSGRPVKSIELARMVASAMGYPSIEIISKGMSFPGDVPRWFADITKIQQLGFRLEHSLEEGILETISWFQESERVQQEVSADF